MKEDLKLLMKEYNYIKLTLATFVTRIGDGIDMIAFSWLVYEITGSTGLVATVFAINMIPNITFGIIAGAICKYVSEKTVLWVCDFGRALNVALIALLYVSGHLEVWHLLIITFLNSTFEAFRSPAQTSIFPKVIKSELQENGLAIQQSTIGVANLIGLACGPICIALFGLGGAIIVDAFSFLFCGLIILLLRKVEPIQSDEQLSVKGYIQDLKAGFVYTKKDKLLINLCIFACFVNAIIVPINIFEAPYMKDYLMVGSEGIAIFGIGQVLGMIVLSPFVPKMKSKLPYRNMLILSGILLGGCLGFYGIMPMFSTTFIYLSLALMSFVAGALLAMLNLPVQYAMYGRVKQEYLSRFSSLMMAFCMAAQPLASCFFGFLSNWVKLDVLYGGVGIVIAVVFVLQVFNKVLFQLNKY